MMKEREMADVPNELPDPEPVEAPADPGPDMPPVQPGEDPGVVNDVPDGGADVGGDAPI